MLDAICAWLKPVTGSLILFGAALDGYAANFYLDSAVAASGDGLSWATAFKTPSAIRWSAINPGDTLNISGGESSKAYSSTLVVGKSGTATNRITIRVGQDAGHTGTAIFEGTGIQVLQNYITISGAVGGEKRLLIRNSFNVITAEYGVAVDAGGTTGLVVEGIAVENCNNGILLTRSTEYTVRDSRFTHMRGDYVIRGIISPGSWDTNKIYGNYIETLWNDVKPPGSGDYSYAGPDGIQPGDGTSIFDNYFVVHRTSDYTSAQHPDTVQLAGSQIKIYNNTFENIGDSNIDFDAWFGGVIQDVYIYNNLFHLVEDVDPYPDFMRFYSTRDPLNSVSNLKILNNTFIDGRTSRAGVGQLIGFGFGNGSGAGSGNEFRNNLFLGTPSRMSITKNTGGAQFSMTFSNNVYPVAQALDKNGIVGVPMLSSDFVPTASDSLARDRGVALGYFSTDKLGTPRPQGTAWDVGSFEFSGKVAPPRNLQVQ